jgi:hypothetical protein
MVKIDLSLNKICSISYKEGPLEQSVSLVMLKKQIFAVFPELEFLFLNGNQISQIFPNQFKPNPKLKVKFSLIAVSKFFFSDFRPECKQNRLGDQLHGVQVPAEHQAPAIPPQLDRDSDHDRPLENPEAPTSPTGRIAMSDLEIQSKEILHRPKITPRQLFLLCKSKLSFRRDSPILELENNNRAQIPKWH